MKVKSLQSKVRKLIHWNTVRSIKYDQKRQKQSAMHVYLFYDVKPGKLEIAGGGSLFNSRYLTAIYSCYWDLVQLVENVFSSRCATFKAATGIQKLDNGENLSYSKSIF